MNNKTREVLARETATIEYKVMMLLAEFTVSEIEGIVTDIENACAKIKGALFLEGE